MKNQHSDGCGLENYRDRRDAFNNWVLHVFCDWSGKDDNNKCCRKLPLDPSLLKPSGNPRLCHLYFICKFIS